MSAGSFVYGHLGAIINHCNNINHDELDNLLDIPYSKRMFDINYAFFIEVTNIDESDKKRHSKHYKKDVYSVCNKKVRITTEWFDYNIPYFKKYLKDKNIQPDIDLGGDTIVVGERTKRNSSRTNSRYKTHAIGNAQNSLIRNILSNLGNESFNKDIWLESKEYFNNRCAYCSADGELDMDHAIPINKEKLGEHKIGNIVPSCKKCNSEKGDKDYKEFLDKNIEARRKIEEYMKSRNYVPLEDNEQFKKVLNMAYEEVSLIADRYIDLINGLFIQT